MNEKLYEQAKKLDERLFKFWQDSDCQDLKLLRISEKAFKRKVRRYNTLYGKKDIERPN